MKEQTILASLHCTMGQRKIHPEQLLHDNAARRVVADIRVKNIERVVDHLQMRKVLVVEHDIDRVAAIFTDNIEVLEAIVRASERRCKLGLASSPSTDRFTSDVLSGDQATGWMAVRQARRFRPGNCRRRPDCAACASVRRDIRLQFASSAKKSRPSLRKIARKVLGGR